MTAPFIRRPGKPPSGKRGIEKIYGFAFPDDFYAFAEFWGKHASLCECLEVSVDGPFEVLTGRAPKGFDPGSCWPRFYKDPPELFTVMIGNTDGLHWGYWFDDPNDAKLEPVVVSYHHNDAFEIGVDGRSLFEALRNDLELWHRDAEARLVDDPRSAEDYEQRLEDYARLREAIAEYGLDDRPEMGEAYFAEYGRAGPTDRKPLANTRSKMGIVVPVEKYRAIAEKDPFETWDFEPNLREVTAFVSAANDAVDAGFPGTALKLGHDLWPYPAFAEESRALLDLAYEALGRDILRDFLRRAIAFRKKCDDERR